MMHYFLERLKRSGWIENKWRRDPFTAYRNSWGNENAKQRDLFIVFSFLNMIDSPAFGYCSF